MDEKEQSINDEESKKGSCGKEHPCGSGACSNPAESAQSAPTACEEPEDEVLGRAQFIRAGFTGVAICWGGMTLVPVMLYLNPPPGGDDEKSKVTSLEVCKLSDLPKGTGKNFRFGSVPALIIHNDDGELHAFTAVCTHLGCTVQYRADMHCIFCACHGGQYNAMTGKNEAGPPPKPLTPLKAEVVGGTIIVSRV